MYMIVEVSQYVAVASFLEAWIEIENTIHKMSIAKVASFLEAWIEIPDLMKHSQIVQESPPSWRRGLKC